MVIHCVQTTDNNMILLFGRTASHHTLCNRRHRHQFEFFFFFREACERRRAHSLARRGIYCRFWTKRGIGELVDTLAGSWVERLSDVRYSLTIKVERTQIY